MKQKKGIYIENLKKKLFLRKILYIVLVIIFLSATIFSTVLLNSFFKDNKKIALQAWKDADYNRVYSIASEALVKQPLSTFWHSLLGYSSYQLATAQTNSAQTSDYVDTSIGSLRIALLKASNSELPRLHYILGKAYFLKGEYYSDLTIKHLNLAQELGYTGNDLYEYLGLSYTQIKDYSKSIEVLTQSLGDYPSDLLLLSIAKNYSFLQDIPNSNAYFIRCIEQTKDVYIKNQARLLLSENYIALNNWELAQKTIEQVLHEEEQNAQAHYLLGVVYAGLEDSIKSRAEWRKALRIDPSHTASRDKLSL